MRRRFVKAETTLFKIRYDEAGPEREAFLSSRDFDWVPVDEEERKKYSKELGEGSKERYYKVRYFDNLKVCG